MLSFKGSFSFPVPAFCCLIAELAGTIKVGILLGIEATEGNSALWVVGVPVAKSVEASGVIDSEVDEAEEEEDLLPATIKPDADGVYAMYVEVEDADASVKVVAWDPVDAGVEVTDSTDRSLVGFSSGSVKNPVSEELAAEVTPDASAVALAEGETVA